MTLVTGLASVIALRVTTARLEHVAGDLGDELTAIQKLRFRAEDAVAASRGYLLTGDKTASARFTDAVASLELALAELHRDRHQLVSGVAEVDIAVHQYVDVARAAMTARTETTDPRDVAQMFEQRVAPARDRLEQTIADFVRRDHAAFEHESGHAHEVAARMQGIVVLATAFGVFLSIALAWVWIRRLAHQYALERDATAAAQRAVAARDEMLAIVSHDLRNPLSTVAMGASLLQTDPATPLAHKHLAAIGNAARRMEHLIGELLDVAKLDSGKLELHVEPCPVSSLLDATVSLFQTRAAEAGIELRADAAPQLSVLADRERVLQVLSNLAGNAFKYTSSGGSVTLTAREVDGAVRLEVTDTGRGIAADEVPHVFERYWQARARGRGSLGLGLYICKQLVEAHHGRIGVHSETGKGSTFWFELPTSAGLASRAAP
ncbi:MAG: sensor histidine kinase [Acidobacteriota bacterium]